MAALRGGAVSYERGTPVHVIRARQREIKHVSGLSQASGAGGAAVDVRPLRPLRPNPNPSERI